jgi:hypothetical protein
LTLNIGAVIVAAPSDWRKCAVTASCSLYLTYRSEYLVLRDLCVGVRDRGSGTWIPLHAAVCAHVLGPHGLADQEEPNGRNIAPITRVRVGERLELYASARRVVTGPIIAVERASESVLNEADRQWQAVFGAATGDYAVARRDSIITLTPRTA